MPVHDWTGVDAGVSEQHAGKRIADVLTLSALPGGAGVSYEACDDGNIVPGFEKAAQAALQQVDGT